MLRRLLVYYWRESCNIRTLAFILVILLLTGFIQTMVWHDDDGEAQLFAPMPVSVVLAEPSFVSSVIIRQLESFDVISKVYIEDINAAKARLDSRETLMIIELPPDFTEDQIISGHSRQDILVYFNEQMPAEANLIARMLNQALDSFIAVQAALSAFSQQLRPVLAEDQVYSRYMEAALLEMSFGLIRRGELVPLDESVRLKQFWFVVSSLISLFAMLPALLVLMLVQQERNSRQHERFLVADVAWWKLHLAKIIIGLMWLLLALLPLTFFVRQILPQLSWQVLFLAVIPLYLVAALFCIALAYRSLRAEAAMLTSWLIFMAALLIGGAIYPQQLMPRWLLFLMPASPANWSFTLLYRALYGYSLDALYLLLFTAVMPVMAAASYFSWRQAR